MRFFTTKRAGGKKPHRHPERAMQVALFKWAAVVSATMPGAGLLFAIPNGAYFGGEMKTLKSGKSVPLAAIRARQMKGEGMKPGVPDVMLPVARGRWHGLFVELKAGSTVSDEQAQWHAALSAQGYCVRVVRGDWQLAAKLIEDYLAGKIV